MNPSGFYVDPILALNDSEAALVERLSKKLTISR